jgi:hypothetical protein
MGSTQLSTEGFKFSLPEAAASELSSKCHWFSENGGLRRGRPTRHDDVIPMICEICKSPPEKSICSSPGVIPIICELGKSPRPPTSNPSLDRSLHSGSCRVGSDVTFFRRTMPNH